MNEIIQHTEKRTFHFQSVQFCETYCDGITRRTPAITVDIEIYLRHHRTEQNVE